MKTSWIFIAIGILSSCSPIYYVPNTQNVPLLSHSGEYNIGGTGNTNMLELQVSASPINHLGLQANGTWFTPQFMPNGDRGRGYFGELGIGYYKTLDIQKKFVFEAYALGGAGHVYNAFMYRDSLTSGGWIDAYAGRYGVQPVIGFKSRYIDVAVSSRFMGLSYFGQTGDLNFEGENQLDYLNRRMNTFLVEPAFTFRAGNDFFKFQVQAQASWNTLYPDFRQMNGLVTFGIMFSPNRYVNIFRKVPKQE